VATRFATKYPERVERLVIGGAVARCDRMSRTQFHVWKRIASAYGVDSEELALHLTTHAFSRTFLDTLGDSAVTAMREETARNVTTGVFLAACDFMIEADTTAELGRITAPTLVMVGDQDVITPLYSGPEGAGAAYMAEHIPDAELCVFEGCGHGNLVERADESIARIVEFLTR
jgi:3-oxoadipate enol-lactonase